MTREQRDFVLFLLLHRGRAFARRPSVRRRIRGLSPAALKAAWGRLSGSDQEALADQVGLPPDHPEFFEALRDYLTR